MENNSNHLSAKEISSYLRNLRADNSDYYDVQYEFEIGFQRRIRRYIADASIDCDKSKLTITDIRMFPLPDELCSDKKAWGVVKRPNAYLCMSESVYKSLCQNDAYARMAVAQAFGDLLIVDATEDDKHFLAKELLAPAELVLEKKEKGIQVLAGYFGVPEEIISEQLQNVSVISF